MSREYPCVYYYGNGKCKKFEEPGYIDYCILGPCTHQTPSNADRIRAMSDEELAEFITGHGVESLCNMICGERCPAIATLHKTAAEMCKITVFKWLKQPASEDMRGAE